MRENHIYYSTRRAGGARWAGHEEVEGDLLTTSSYLKGSYKGDGAKLP